MHIDRRALLIGAGAVAGGVALGTLADRLGWWDPTILGARDPDAAIARLIRSQEAIVVRAYDEAIAGGGGDAPTADRLATYRQHHADHLSELGGSERDVDDAPAPGEDDPERAEGAPAPAAALPTPDQWPGYFAALEEQHSGLLSTGVRISGGEQARLLSLITASESAHVLGWSGG